MSDLHRLADEQFVRLTTFKRDGTPVPTTVWLVGDGDDLLVTTLGTTGKAKRIRHTSRVLLVPSSRSGEIEDGATEIEARATVFDDPASLDRLNGLIKKKYGLLARGLLGFRAVSGKTDAAIGIRIVPADA